MPARLAVAALALACALAVPVLLSDDVWAYAAYGALLAHGVDPWAHAFGAADIARLHDPLAGEALARWGGSLPRDVYGPLFTLPCALAVAALERFGPGAPVAALRLLACGALLACIALAGAARPRLASLLAFHPVVLWSAAEGHNDPWWLALVLAAGAAGRARPAVLAAAAAVKAVALVPLIWLLRGSAPRTRILTAAAVLAAYLPLLHGLAAGGLDRGLGPPRLSLLHAPAGWALAGLAAGALGVGRAWRRGERASAATLGAWLVLPAPEPWYALWLLPALAVDWGRPAAQALLAATFSGALLYLQDAPGTALHDPALLGGIMFAVYALPLLLALQSSPQPTPLPAASAPPQPAATAAPLPAASPTPSPAPASPAPQAAFGYVLTPPPQTAGPQILEIAVNDKVQHVGGDLRLQVRTSLDASSVVLRAMGHEIAVPQTGPGLFGAQQRLPGGIPFFLVHRWYDVSVVATDGNGRSNSVVVPVRLEY